MMARSDNAANANDELDWAIRIYNNKLSSFVVVSSTIYVAEKSTTLSTGTWYFAAMYYDSSTNKVGVSLNASAWTETSVTGTINTGGDQVKFARLSYQSGWDNYYNGRLDEWGHWGRVLTTAELTELYNSGNGLSYSDL
jgi:hypothetical protein